MKDKIQKDIDKIKENISVLPKNNKTNKQKYLDYIDLQIKEYTKKLEDVKKEISSRYDKYLDDFNNDEDIPKVEDIDINTIRGLDNRTSSFEKMNLAYYFYELSHFYEHNISKINEIILKILGIFKSVNIELTKKDFNYSDCVYEYIETLLESNEHIYEILDKLYWENPNIIIQIELNFRYLYFKYEKEIDKFYNIKFNHQTLNSYLKDNFVKTVQANNKKHRNKKYIYSLFVNSKVSIVDFNAKNLDSLIEELLLDKKSENNYVNLQKLEQSLLEYDKYTDFEYVIKDMQELYSKKNEYKDIYQNKLKEIKKSEGKLFKLNKSINKSGLFKKSNNQLGRIKLDRNNLIDEIHNGYKELDSLRIKDLIYKYVNDDTSFLDVIRIASYDFNYFISLLKENIDKLDLNIIDQNIRKIYHFAFGINHNIFSNIAIVENKNISQIIADRYRLINISINEENINKGNTEKLLIKVRNLLLYFDMQKIDINMDNLQFVLDVHKKLKK